MDIKNVIAAISLSALVLILYSVFFAPPLPDLNEEKNKVENTKNDSDNEQPYTSYDDICNDPDLVETNGIPAPKINYKMSENSKKILDRLTRFWFLSFSPVEKIFIEHGLLKIAKIIRNVI